MKSLSHWDAKTIFTAKEVAELVIGIDPDEPGDDKTKARHTYQRGRCQLS